MARPKALIGWIDPQPLLAVILWGGVYPGSKLGLRGIPVTSFTALRILLATAVLFAVSCRARPLTLPRHLWGPALGAGLAQTAFQVFLIAGLHRTSAGNSAILVATSPLLATGWLALMAAALLGESLSAIQAAGAMLAFMGVWLSS